VQLKNGIHLPRGLLARRRLVGVPLEPPVQRALPQGRGHGRFRFLPGRLFLRGTGHLLICVAVFAESELRSNYAAICAPLP